jgi:hypothetical protein
MKVFLHIGTDKTGSTAIQQHLYVNRQWLLARGVYVPLTGLGKDNGHQILLNTMADEKMSCLADELAAAKNNGFTSAIISWEGMRFFRPRQIKRLIKMLHSDNLWVLVYLREQADIIQTGYLQKLKKNRSRIKISDFHGGLWTLSRLSALLSCYSPVWNYARLVQKWTRFLPDGHMLVREFEKQLLVNGSVVDDFLSVLGLCPDDEFVRIKRTVNISLDIESAILIHEHDEHGNSDESRKIKEYSLLSLIDSEGYGARFFLSARRVRFIRRFYCKSNESIRRLVSLPSPEIFLKSPDCSKNYSPDYMLRSIEARRTKLSVLMRIPMLFGTRAPHKLPTLDLLAFGWSQVYDWGAWSTGDRSIIRFRVPFWMATRDNAKLSVFLKGRYYGKNTGSNVSVNGVHFGCIDLREFPRSITIPISSLHKNQVVEVQLVHQFPEQAVIESSAVDGQPISFCIEKFGFNFSNREMDEPQN